MRPVADCLNAVKISVDNGPFALFEISRTSAGREIAMIELAKEQRIGFDRDTVWRNLFDLAILQASIPGCEDLQQIDEDRYTARVVLKIGPIKARFTGEIRFSDLDRPRAFSLSGAGQGGIAGFAQGTAHVRLEEHAEGCTLVYTAKAEIGGRLAQLGGRLIESTVNKLAEQFFRSFAEAVQAREAAA